MSLLTDSLPNIRGLWHLITLWRGPTFFLRNQTRGRRAFNMSKRLFLSYARGDDDGFARKLYGDLIACGFDVWFDEVSMPSRELTFLQEIRDAIAAHDRVVLLLGPEAATSEYVTMEWRSALEMGKGVTCLVRRDGTASDGARVDGYLYVPEVLRTQHCEDFRDDTDYERHLVNILRQLREPAPSVGRLVGVPGLPTHYRVRSRDLDSLRDALLADVRRPLFLTGASARIGVDGMPGVGKSVLAAAMARDLAVRRLFADGLVWVSVGQEPNVVELQRLVALALGDDASFDNAGTGREVIRQLLHDRAVLLILDDLWQRSHGDAFDALGVRCKLLFTTRDASIAAEWAETNFHVQLPNETEALALLADAAGAARDSPLAPLARIVGECGRLPLALALCGGLARAGTPWGDICDALEARDLEFFENQHPVEQQHLSLWRAMNASTAILPEEHRRRFAELAVFAADSQVPEDAVSTLWAHTGGLHERHGRKLLVQFRQRSLVQIEELAGSSRTVRVVSMHDLLHDFAVRLADHYLGGDLARHQVVLDAYSAKCSGVWFTAPDDGYFFQRIAHHFLRAGRIHEFEALLFDMRWLEAKVLASGWSSLLQDLELVSNSQGRATEREDALQVLTDAVRLSSTAVVRDPSEITGQLLRRLLDHRNATIGALVSQALSSHPRPCLLPTVPTLMRPSGPVEAAFHGNSRGVSKFVLHAKRPYITIACYGPDHRIFIWDRTTGQLVSTLIGHEHVVTELAHLQDESLLVSASRDGAVVVWHLETSRPIHCIKAHDLEVTHLAVSADGRRMATASKREQKDYKSTEFKVWDTATGALVNSFNGGLEEIALSHDGRVVVVCSSGWEAQLHIADADSGKVRALSLGNGVVTAFALARRGQTLVAGSSDGTFGAWELASGRALFSERAHAGPITQIEVADDAGCVLSASTDERNGAKRDNTARIWSLESGECLHTFASKGSLELVALSPDGSKCILAGSGLDVWDAKKGTHEWHLSDAGIVDQVVFNRDGSCAAFHSKYGESLEVLALNEPRMHFTCTGHGLRTVGYSGQVKDPKFTADGGTVVTSGSDGTVRPWRLDRLTRAGGSKQTSRMERRSRRASLVEDHQHAGAVNALAFSPDERRVFSGAEDGLLGVWDVATGRVSAGLQGHTSAITAIAVADDGRLVVTGSGVRFISWTDGRLGVWDVTDGSRKFELGERYDQTYRLATTPDGRLAVAAGERHLRAWDLTTGECAHEFTGHRGPHYDLAILRGGRELVSASRDSTLRRWELPSGECAGVLEGHSKPVVKLAVTSAGDRAVSGCWDGDVVVWDLSRNRLLSRLKHHESEIAALALSDAAGLLVSGARDGTVCVWDLKQHVLLGELPGARDVIVDIRIDTSGTRAIVGSSDGVSMWDLRSRTKVAGYTPDSPVTALAVATSFSSLVVGDCAGFIHFLKV